MWGEVDGGSNPRRVWIFFLKKNENLEREYPKFLRGLIILGKKDFPRWFSASLSSDEIVVVEIVVKFTQKEAAHLVEEFLNINVICAATCNSLYLFLHLIAGTVY